MKRFKGKMKIDEHIFQILYLISIWFILKSKRGTSLMESIFSRCHNYMYSHRWIKSKIFINEYNQQIYTAPNPLIVHGILH